MASAGRSGIRRYRTRHFLRPAPPTWDMREEVIKIEIPSHGEPEDGFIEAKITFAYASPERIEGYGLKPGEWRFTGIDSAEPVEGAALEEAIESAREKLRAFTL